MPRKPRAQATNKARSEVLKPDDVQVPDVDALANACAVGINRVLGLQYLRFEKIYGDYSNSRREKLTLRLKAPSSVEALEFEADRIHLVLPFLRTRHAQYWLGGTLELSIPSGKRKTFLTQVSLIVFESVVAQEDEKRAVLRVEWDCSKHYRRHDHAQPHWHVYSSLLNPGINDLGALAFKEDPLIQNFPRNEQAINEWDPAAATIGAQSESEEELAWAGSPKFHFAMAAHWQVLHLESETIEGSKRLKKPDHEELQVSTLGNWMGLCVDYIKEQLRYVDRRLYGISIDDY